MEGWVDVNLPYYDLGVKGSFVTRGLNNPGTLIEVRLKENTSVVYLIGDINPHKGMCSCCEAFGSEVIVIRYKVIYLSE